MALALERVRVLDVTHVLAGPTCTMILADLGAEVIKVEPLDGDDARRFPPFQNDESGYFMSINRNKKGIALDLKAEEAKEVLRKLIKICDAFVENFRPGVMSGLGFGPEEVLRLNPKIVYASISGFGHSGPYMQRPAYDMVAQGMSGIMSITGEEERPPVRVGTSIGDIIAGHQAAIGILAALLWRERSGQGQHVDCAMLDGLVYILENAVVRYTISAEVPHAFGTAHPSITPFQAFRTKDGYIITPIGNDALWLKFCRALGLEELANDPKFRTNSKRTKNRGELAALLERALMGKTYQEWSQIFAEWGLPYAPINSVDKMVADPQVNEREMIVEFEHPIAGEVKMVGCPIKLSQTPPQMRMPPPILGQHTEEILKDLLGYSLEDVKELRRRKVIV
jgi:CoA:oxalate CoA-transferase